MQVIQREPWEHIKDEDIKKVAASFSGEIWQVPPMFSAIKVSILCSTYSDDSKIGVSRDIVESWRFHILSPNNVCFNVKCHISSKLGEKCSTGFS